MIWFTDAIFILLGIFTMYFIYKLEKSDLAQSVNVPTVWSEVNFTNDFGIYYLKHKQTFIKD